MAKDTVGLKRISEVCWEIPKTAKMLVPGRIYASEAMIPDILRDATLQQVANVAQLPGIIKYSYAMPDMHWGYGFPIGGVAAFSMDQGIISPGGVGYDINCGCRLLRTNLMAEDIKGTLRELVLALFQNVPCGVGSTGSVKLSQAQTAQVLSKGSAWAVKQGYGLAEDLERTEDQGAMPTADPEAVSDRAYKRGHDQLGTLGSGNHFLEIGVVDKVYDSAAADAFGLRKDMVTVLMHSGSRGLGHQVCDDFLAEMNQESHRLGLELPDRQLACALLGSPLARRYLGAMAAAANFAWANRQVLTYLIREAFEATLKAGPAQLGMQLVYDVCHNIAKIESHLVEGTAQPVCVHRKGATRSLGPGHPGLPEIYRKSGQPVLIPGDMGTHSYVLKGTTRAAEETFSSTCHGAGRVMSRTQAKKAAKGRAIGRELEDRGIIVRWTGRHTLAEEIPEAYKNVSEVAEVVDKAGLSTKVARLRPLGVV
ncbi:MAG: RtcB family protein, partial [Deltaproteobacteria bacterium]|nr:RtcB family protein [Deltaproteobacteria bacterium]